MTRKYLAWRKQSCFLFLTDEKWRLFGWLSPLFSKSGTFPEQFWITNYDCPLSNSFTYSTPSSVFGSYMHNLANLEQIADEDRGPFSVHPNPHLKYLRGYCRNTDKVYFFKRSIWTYYNTNLILGIKRFMSDLSEAGTNIFLCYFHSGRDIWRRRLEPSFA